MPQFVREHARLAAICDGNDRVRRAEIDTKYVGPCHERRMPEEVWVHQWPEMGGECSLRAILPGSIVHESTSWTPVQRCLPETGHVRRYAYIQCMNDTRLQILDILRQRADRRTDVGHLAARLSVSRTQVAEALLHLERKGLVDAGELRLTLGGLAAAQALAAQVRSVAA